MPTFTAPDGTLLAYRSLGAGEPLVCLPGGPMQDSAYLGDLGGLAARRRLIVLDLRGTGGSAIPADTSSYRADRQVDDVEALRVHLGLERMDLLAHSAGTNLAILYALRHPAHVGRLLLIAPSLFAAGIAVSAETRLDVARRRKDEPWFPRAYAALEAITAGRGTDWPAIAPLRHGRWDADAQAYEAAIEPQTNQEAAEIFAADGVFDPPAVRAALARYDGPVLLVAGEFDVNSPPTAVAELAALLSAATLVVQPGAGHNPWRDDPAAFTALLRR
ncbi:MAG: alpha/beta hydrolase [Actinoplanes sp.]